MPKRRTLPWRGYLLTIPFAIMSCSAPRMPPPTSLQSSIIGVRIATEDELGLRKTTADKVYFASLDTDGHLPCDELVESNYCDGDYQFLINAKPGTYVVVAADSMVSTTSAPAANGRAAISYTTRQFTYLPEPTVRSTMLTVKPGTLTFMGEFILDQSSKFSKADPLQLHYYRLLQPGEEGASLLIKALSGVLGFRGSLAREDRSAKAQERFRKRTRTRIEAAGWVPVLEPPAAAEGKSP